MPLSVVYAIIHISGSTFVYIMHISFNIFTFNDLVYHSLFDISISFNDFVYHVHIQFSQIYSYKVLIKIYKCTEQMFNLGIPQKITFTLIGATKHWIKVLRDDGISTTWSFLIFSMGGNSI